MDVDLLRPGTVPISGDSVLWFEFVLNPTVLENHVKKKNPDPSPTELIVKFLSISSDQKDVDVKLNDQELTEVGKCDEPVKKISSKSLALKISSLKVAAFLKWDLTVLENKLPLPMQVKLLHNFLYITMEKEAPVESHLDMDLSLVSEQVLFALTLYHRWVLRAVMYSRLSTKQTKMPYIPVPGLQDPNFVPSNVMEEIYRGLESQVQHSIMILNRIATLPAPRIPSYDTFVMLTEYNTSVTHRWETGISVSDQEFLCQLHYELASFHFFREEYSLACCHVEKCRDLDAVLTGSMWYCTVSRDKLQGYVEACNVAPATSAPNLLQQMHKAIMDQYTGIVQILQADNMAREIPQVYRDNLELDIQGALSSGKFTVARDLLLQVQTLNVVNRAVTGSVTSNDYVNTLSLNKPRSVTILLNALQAVLPTVSPTQRQSVKYFLHDLMAQDCVEGFVTNVVACPTLQQLFEPGELERLDLDSPVDVPNALLTSNWSVPDPALQALVAANPRLGTGSLEQQLILSYDPAEIKDLLGKLGTMGSKKQLWKINNKWELPIPVQSVVLNLPQGMTQDYAYILIAKSRELTTIKDFVAAEKLLTIVGQDVKQSGSANKNVLYKLPRLLFWDSLLIRITQFLIEWPAKHINTQQLGADCKSCLSTLQSGDSVIPRLEILEHCAICLLNLAEWDYVTTLEKRWNFFELVVAVANACLDIVKHKGNKKVTKEAWDIILPVFGSNMQQKRNSSGGSMMMHRNSPTNCGSTHTRTSLTQFLSGLRDATALAVVMSLLARLHNVLRDEPSLELNVEYAGLWPAVVSNANSYHTRGVCEVLSQLLVQALKFHPTNVSWLKLMGDIHFVTGHYAAALKHYLEAGIVVSDFFSQPLPRNVIGNHVYRHMIKCCSHLHCHTQAAVLCQFLEDVDYTTAFKSLGEVKTSSCSDAMDSYYSCIWDITMLEYLVSLHTKRGEHHRKQQAIKVIGLLELNSNNNEEIQREAANIRKSRFLRAMARQYIC